MISISDNTIKNNGWSGIYSGKRRLSVFNNDVHDNGKDGIDIEAGSRVWISENDAENNRGSGLKLAIDGSDIWTSKNDVRNNQREGLEIIFGGTAGRINISKSKFAENGRHGIARLQAVPGGADLWAKYLTIENNNGIWGNGLGNISKIFFVKK